MSEMDDFIMCHIYLPEVEKVVNAYMAQFMMYEKAIINLSQRNIFGMILSIFIPDSTENSKEKVVKNDTRSYF